jgi:hypothetical protein
LDEHHLRLNLIRATVAAFEREGLSDIRAVDLPCFPRPRELGGIVPDASGNFDSTPVVALLAPRAVETNGVAALHSQVYQRNGIFIVVTQESQREAVSASTGSISEGRTDVIAWSF